jgi:phage baseplate assembly protein W
MAVETPHFAHPFAFAEQPDGSLAALVDEQDSLEEITGCIARIVSFPRGSRDELPDFGIDDPTFEQAPVDVRLLSAQVAEWEDRVEVQADATIDTADDLISHVRLTIDPNAEGE